MRKLAQAISVAMGMAVVSGPALAAGFIVDNDTDRMIYAACGPVFSVSPRTASDIIDCSSGMTILDAGGDHDEHAHGCSDPTPVHRIEVTTSSVIGDDGMNELEFSHSCESAQ